MNKDQMIKLLSEDLSREMTHMLFYLKNSATLRGLHRQEIRELFLEEAASEMKHVQAFQDLIIGLKGDVWDVMPANPKTFTDPQTALQAAYEMETQVVENYTERIKQATELGGVDGQFIEIFLEEQLLHSRTDADNFRLLIS